MLGVGRVPLVGVLLIAVLAGGLYGLAASQPATADAAHDGGVAGLSTTPVPLNHSQFQSMDRRAAPPSPEQSATTTADSVASGEFETAVSDEFTTDSASRPLTGGLDASSQSDGDPADGIVLSQGFRRLPDEPGQVAVTYNYSIPDRVVSLRTAVPGRGNVTATDGFQPVNGTVYDWDEATVDPTITYRLGVNETGSGDHAVANGTHLFADVGEWSLFRRPPTSTSWEFRGREPVAFDRRTVTAGPGAAGDWLVYLGEGRLYTRENDGETFRLVVPTPANVSETPDDVLDAMERAAQDIDVGDPEDGTFAVAAPTDSVPWAVRGLSVEGTDFWVGARERLNTTDNIWIHEYVHTRQAYEPTNGTRWTREGFASYYAAVHALRHQDVSFSEFAERLEIDGSPGNVTLADPATWRNRTAYDRGALVAGHLDRRIRSATEGDRSLDAVLVGMNDHSGPVNASSFFALADRAMGNSTDGAIRTAVRTDRPVDMWNRTQHVRSFGGMPPRIEVATPEAPASPYRVRGPYRNGSLDGSTPTIVTGETIVVDAEVRNDGGTVGYYDVDLAVDGDILDTVDGEIPANGSRRVSLAAAFEDPGEYTIDVGGHTETVSVVQPASATPVGFNVSRTTVQQYESAAVDVRVQNGLTIPARRTVTVQRAGQDVLTRAVHVGPNETRTVAFDVQFPTSGTTSVSIDGFDAMEIEVEPRDQPTTVDGTPGTDTRAPATGPSSALGPGPGILGALLVVLATLLVARHRA